MPAQTGQEQTQAGEAAPEAAIEAAQAGKYQNRGFAPPPADEVTETEAEAGEGQLAEGFEFPGAPEEKTAEAEAEETAEEESYRIGTRTFRTQKEAWTYAEELDREKLASDAFRQGVETAQAANQGNPPEVIAAQEPEEELPDYYYTDPKRYAKEQREKAVAEAEQRVLGRLEAERRHSKTMSDFYSDYPDLVGDEELVKVLIGQNWNQISRLDVKPGLKIIADQARNWIEDRVRRRMPAQELKRTANIASSGGAQKVTQKKQDEKPMDFVSQNRKLKTPQGKAEARKRLGMTR